MILAGSRLLVLRCWGLAMMVSLSRFSDLWVVTRAVVETDC